MSKLFDAFWSLKKSCCFIVMIEGEWVRENSKHCQSCCHEILHHKRLTIFFLLFNKKKTVTKNIKGIKKYDRKLRNIWNLWHFALLHFNWFYRQFFFCTFTDHKQALWYLEQSGNIKRAPTLGIRSEKNFWAIL